MQRRLVLAVILTSVFLVGAEKKTWQKRAEQRDLSFGLDDLWIGSSLRWHHDPSNLSSLATTKVLANDLDETLFLAKEKVTGLNVVSLGSSEVFCWSVSKKLLKKRARLIISHRETKDATAQKKRIYSCDDMYLSKSLRLHRNPFSMTKMLVYSALIEQKFSSLKKAKEILRPRSEMSPEERALEEKRDLEIEIERLKIVPQNESYLAYQARHYRLYLALRELAGEDISNEPGVMDFVDRLW